MTEIITKKLKPIWDEIDHARELCSTNLKENNYDMDVVDAIIMISSELLENAIKYGNYDNSQKDTFTKYI